MAKEKKPIEPEIEEPIEPTVEESGEGEFTTESAKEKFNETWDKIQHDARVENVIQFAKTNTRDTIAYILLFLGIFLLLFRSLWGGLLVGVVGGIYFSDEIWTFIKRLNTYIEEEGLVKSLILGGVTLAFFIEALMIFIGAALAVVIKQMVAPKKVD